MLVDTKNFCVSQKKVWFYSDMNVHVKTVTVVIKVELKTTLFDFHLGKI